MTGDRTRALRASRRKQGFTLVEALVGVALMGVVLAMLGTITARWLPTWNIGFGRLQRAEHVGLAVDRIAADLVSAEFVALDPKSQRATFDGTSSSVILVRSALGPNAVEGLEIIRIAEEEDANGIALVRSRAPFALLGTGDGDVAALAFTDKVTLLRPPFRVAFAFADTTLAWKDLWRGAPTLPSAVRIAVEDRSKAKGVFVSVIAALHMSAAAACTRAGSAWNCVEELARTGAVRTEANASEKER
jgi:general secretion pathway protein J